MKKYLLRFSAFVFVAFQLFSCKGKDPNSNHASVLPRGNQQSPIDRFEDEIKKFEEADQVKMPPKDAVLFVGSSSIRMWTHLTSDFEPMPVINRGFGGSTVPEVIHYAERIVYKYQPKVIVFYCGENDLADQTPPAVVFQNLKKFVGGIEQKLPNTKLLFISAKPSPQRWHLWREIQQYNTMVEQFASSRKNMRFADIRSALIAADGKPDPGLFVEDKLHLNSDGYQRWVNVLKPIVTEMYSDAVQ
jgi:lysophospholipase L1-like esterase